MPRTATCTGVWKQKRVRNYPPCRELALPFYLLLSVSGREGGRRSSDKKKQRLSCLWESPPKTFMQLLACRELAGLLTMPASMQHPSKDQDTAQPPSSILPGAWEELLGSHSFMCHSSVFQLVQMSGYMSQGRDIFGLAGAWCVPCPVGRESMRGQKELLSQMTSKNSAQKETEPSAGGLSSPSHPD